MPELSADAWEALFERRDYSGGAPGGKGDDVRFCRASDAQAACDSRPAPLKDPQIDFSAADHPMSSGQKPRRNGLTYKDAGVDIEAGDALVARIAPAAKATRRPGADANLGGFGGLFDLAAAGFKDPVLVASTDGVGTKLKIAIDTGILGGIGQDLVAMCVNDIVVQGAEPLFFLDYYATGKLDVAGAATVV